MQAERLTDADLQDAAKLAAERHTQARKQFAFLPETYEDPVECHAHLRKMLTEENANAYAVREAGRLLGFAIGQPALMPPGSLMARYIEERSASIPLGGHGVAPGADAFAVYSALYGALARDWVRTGLLAHSFQLYGNESELQDVMVDLGFGRKMVTAVAPVHPIDVRDVDVEIHRAAAEDLDAVMRLEHELTDYHTEAPMFMALDPLTDQSMLEFQKALLKLEGNAHFIGYRAGRPVGMVTFQNPPIFLGRELRGDKVIYLYEGIVSSEARSGGVGEVLLSQAMEWMADQGITHCGLHYHAANAIGGPFWRKHGFEAVEHTMLRVLDSRIAWARKW